MEKIDSGKLTELLNDGFDGIVQLEGKLWVLSDPKFSSSFLQYQGKIRLSNPVRTNNPEKNDGYRIICEGDKNSLFEFKFYRRRYAHAHEYNGGINIPIDLTPTGCVVLENPERIFC